MGLITPGPVQRSFAFCLFCTPQILEFIFYFVIFIRRKLYVLDAVRMMRKM